MEYIIEFLDSHIQGYQIKSIWLNLIQELITIEGHRGELHSQLSIAMGKKIQKFRIILVEFFDTMCLHKQLKKKIKQKQKLKKNPAN